MVNGSKTSNMERELKHGQMDLSMREDMKMVRKPETVDSYIFADKSVFDGDFKLNEING